MVQPEILTKESRPF